MSTTLLRHVLRATAILIAVAGLLDPSLAGRSRPRIAIIDMTRDATGSPRATSPMADATNGPARKVAAALGESMTLTTRRDPTADAWIVVGDADEVDVPAPPPGIPLSLVTPRPPPAALTIDHVDAPTRVGVATRVPVSVTVTARGLKGASTTLAVRSGELVLARVTHAWTADPERFVARLEVTPAWSGANHLIVEALDGSGRSARSRADVVVLVDERRWPVLVFDARPSWTTTFVRRTLEADTRFAVTFATRVSRGITASTGAPGSTADGARTASVDRLTPAALDPFTLAIVGAPDALGAGEVAALRGFVSRGSALVLAPDGRPAGPYVALLGGAVFEERLLDEPVALGSEAPGVALLASELAVVRRLPAGARPIATSGGGATTAASIWTANWGDGQTLFVGALDAWRFRGRSGDAFDRWWPLVADWLASEAAEPLTITTTPRAAAPGAAVSVRVRLRGAAPTLASTTVEATLAPAGGSGTNGSDSRTVRLWPGAERGVFAGDLNVPAAPGVYAVSASATAAGSSGRATASAPLIVAPGARQARPPDDRWRMAATASGGVVTTVDEVSGLVGSLRRRSDGGRSPAPTERAPEPTGRARPMRSAWWLLPLALCLGGEWWLRRRGGQR